MTKTTTGSSLTAAVKGELQSKFDLNKFKDKKMLKSNVKFKEQRWIPFSKSLKEALSIPGIPMGHITLARGRSDTGKTTLLIETAIEAQKMNVLPVFIMTEMKWDFQHAKKMGFQVNEVVDEETGAIDYSGFFIYVDRSSLNTIEDVAHFIMDLLDEQKKGNLPYDLLFLWDSSGSIPCQMSVDQGKNNPMWNAGAMATQFGNFVNQKFPLSRKENYPYTNTFFVINKVGVQPPENVFSQPKMTNKGGDALYWDASLVITFGNVTNSGTSKLKAVKNKKTVEFAKRTKIAIDKLHTDEGIATKAVIIVTPHGFIDDSTKAIDDYKKLYSTQWFTDAPGSGEISIVEDTSEWEETRNISSILLEEDMSNTTTTE
jgi:hypothetical protein